MSIIIQYLHVIGAFQGLLLAGLLIFGSQISIASRILGAWCLLMGLNFLGPFIYINGEINAFSPLIGLHIFLPASYGAFLYLYCRHAIINCPLSLKDFWHFLPFFLCYLINIELYLSPPEVKLDAILHGPPNATLILIAQAIMAIQAFGYLALSMIMVRRYQREAKKTVSNFNPELFTWLWTILILDLVIWTIKSISTSVEYQQYFVILGDALIIVLIYSIAMAQWRNPQLFKISQLRISGTNSNITDLSQSTSAEQVSDHEVKDLSNSTAQHSGALDPDTRSNLLTVVRQHMQEHKTYMDNQLTLSRLAETVGISTHHLSEVLNQHEGKNFYQFVNEYRIDFVCQQLEIDKEIKILDLAMTAGFSSKSTFNAVFKQFVKQTPSQYRQQLTQ